MKLFDSDDKKALADLAGAAVVAFGALAVVAVSGAGILGLAVRVFQLAMG